MAHTVHHSPETGHWIVVKDGEVICSFPTEGEANLQVIYLDGPPSETPAAAATRHEAKTPPRQR